MNGAKGYENFLKAVTRGHVSEYHVDLQEDTYVAYKISETTDWTSAYEGRWTDLKNQFVEECIPDAFKKELDYTFSIESIRNHISKNNSYWCVSFPTQIFGSYYWREMDIYLDDCLEDGSAHHVAIVVLDITNERLSQLRQIENEELYRDAILKNNLFCYTVNISRNLIEEDIICRVDGEERSVIEFVGLSVPCTYDEFLEKADKKIRRSWAVWGSKEWLQKYSEGENYKLFEYEIEVPQGRTRILEQVDTVFEDKLSKEVYLVCYAKDVTKQRMEVRALREREKFQLEAFKQAIPGGFRICEDDLEMTQKYISPKLAAMLGYTPEEMMERTKGHLRTLIHEEDRKRILPIWEKVYKAEDSFNLKYRLLAKNGEYRWVQEVGRRVFLEHGKTEYYCVLVDVTEAEQRLEELHKANQNIIRERSQYRDALNAKALFCYEIDLMTGIIEESTITKIDGEIMKICEVEKPVRFETYAQHRKEYMKETWNKGDEKYWTVDGLLEAFKNGNTNIEVEYFCEVRNRYLRTNFLISEDIIDGHAKAIVISNDITEQRNKEEQSKKDLLLAYQEAERANQAKSNFLSRMSHDMRTPMNGIIGMTAIARENVNDKNRLEDSLYKIDLTSHHLLNLINDVLDMSKLESGHVEVVRQPFNLQKIVRDTTILFEQQLHDANLQYEIPRWEVTHGQLIGNPMIIQRIITNIITNCIKYNKSGGRVMASCIELSSTEKIANFQFTIEDTGIGMAEDFLPHIFEAFSQENGGARTKYKGTGLGMSIVKSLVDAAGGSIQVESELGVGSKFIIELPLEIDTTVEARTASKSKTEHNFSDKRILVAEDNGINLEIIEYILTKMGAKVEASMNGKEALDLYLEKPVGYYDMIFIDIMMPIMDGHEATRQIRKSGKEDAATIPIIAMTANAFMEDIKAAKKAGMNEHIAKPLNVTKIKNVMEQYL